MFWCVKCAKYLTFDTFERPDDSALTRGLIPCAVCFVLFILCAVWFVLFCLVFFFFFFFFQNFIYIMNPNPLGFNTSLKTSILFLYINYNNEKIRDLTFG